MVWKDIRSKLNISKLRSFLSFSILRPTLFGGGRCQNPGGTQLWVTLHVPPKTPYFFSLAFTERPPFLPTFTQWPPIFNKLLVTERPDTSLSLKDPHFAFNNGQTSDNFWQKIWFFENFMKCWEIFDHFGPESPYFMMHFTERPPIFVHFVTESPLFLSNLSPKDPYIWGAALLGGTRTSLSYVSVPRGQNVIRGVKMLIFPMVCL